MCKMFAGNSHPCYVVKLCRINKDDKNVGTVGEGVFSRRDFPSVKQWAGMVINSKSLACHIISANTYNVLM